MMKEEDIRPKKIFDEYLKLTEQDTIKYFSDAVREHIQCPACKSKGEFSFSKQGFDYEECLECRTLYVNPRPVAESFSRYYQESDSVAFWASTFYKETAEARREKIWKPRAELIYRTLEEKGKENLHLIDIGGGYGIFAEEYLNLFSKNVIVIEPGSDLAKVCRNKGLDVIEEFLENIIPESLPSTGKVFVSFELFEHLHNPELFLNQLYKLMLPGDIFIFTTLSGTGVDIQSLWEHSKSISPPHHLNFFNPHSVKLVLENSGFSNVVVTTPGKLDLDIMKNNVGKIKDRFWETFLDQADEAKKDKMQAFLSANGLSSHMMVICIKPERIIK